MSKRCELQKEYYKANGNYKGSGKYSDGYVMWLENQVLALRQLDVSGCNSDKLVECSNCGDRVKMISSGEFCPHCFC
jgi:hypothetical protein